ncbi:MAG: NUDIX domain-containing protein [Pseudomonadales bacterium]|nr:NUDIX domain-containing protein [Pseudomonadales bacterium]
MSKQIDVTRVAAYGLVTRSDEILLCRISERFPAKTGCWTLPGGGINFREDPVDAMIREVQEETGLIVESSGLAGVNANSVDTDDVRYHGIQVLYHARVLGGELTNELDGTTDLCQWWRVGNLGEIDLVDLVEYGVGLAFTD